MTRKCVCGSLLGVTEKERDHHFSRCKDGLISKLNKQIAGLNIDFLCARDRERKQTSRALDALEKVGKLELQIEDLRAHLKYVCMIAERLGPKASKVHREEALHMLDGTIKDAEELFVRTGKKKGLIVICPGPGCTFALGVGVTHGPTCPDKRVISVPKRKCTCGDQSGDPADHLPECPYWHS